MKFIYEAYAKMLDNLLLHGYNIASYDNWNKYERCAILRHDIDYNIKKAVELAKLEHRLGCTATYFVLVTSDFYNIFSKECVDGLKQIISCGHSIGLHFDEMRYPEIVGDVEAIKSKIKEEAKLLVLYPVSNNTLQFRKNLLYSIKNGIGGRRYATLHCHADKR